jgi:putative MATE family efflux protein
LKKVKSLPQKSQSKDLTQGPVWKNLAKIAWPMVFGIVAVMSISIVDSYFVGQLGTKPLAALSFTFPVSFTITSLAIGLSAGAASIVSRAKGAQNNEKMCRTATDSLLLSLFFVMIICAIGFLTIRPLFGLMGAQGETLDLVERYMRIWYASMPMLVIPMVVNGLIRSVGDSFWPSIIMIFSAFINIVLTPIFIKGLGPIPAFHIEGAAIATAIAYFFSLLFALYILIFREHLVSFKIPDMEKLMSSWKEIVHIGLPASLGNATNPLAIGIVTALIAAYGDDAVAAFGPATRIESFAAIIMLALSSAIGPVSGQNWGANKKDRVIDALKISYKVSLGWAIILAVLFWLTADFFANLFTDNQSVADIIALYLVITPITLWGYGITIVSAGCFNAIGHPLTGLGIYLLRSAAFYVPLSFIATLFFSGSVSIFIAIALSNCLAGILIAFYALNKLKKL